MSTLTEQIACVKREIALRINTYPKLVRDGRMKQHVADREIAVMKEVLVTLLQAERVQAQLPEGYERFTYRPEETLYGEVEEPSAMVADPEGEWVRVPRVKAA